MSTRRSMVWVAFFAVAALLASATGAAAAGGPPPGRGGGGGGGGGGGETTLGNNLSVPTIFVGGLPATPVVRSATLAPSDQVYGPVGAQSTQFPGYWVQQSEATWRAAYIAVQPGPDDPVLAVANWSDNLTKHQWAARQPIRVEMVLYDPDEVLTGFVMTNLTPTLDDRVAVFGTDGAIFQTPFVGTEGTVYTRVFVPGATLSIVRDDGMVVYNGPMTAEMNAGGAVTYGYNWGIKGKTNMPQAGTYTLTFRLPGSANAELSGLDPLDLNPVVAAAEGEEGGGILYEPTFDPNEPLVTTVTITINPSGGGRG
jgi:hypothetical protein